MFGAPAGFVRAGLLWALVAVLLMSSPVNVVCCGFSIGARPWPDCWHDGARVAARAPERPKSPAKWPGSLACGKGAAIACCGRVERLFVPESVVADGRSRNPQWLMSERSAKPWRRQYRGRFRRSAPGLCRACRSRWPRWLAKRSPSIRSRFVGESPACSDRAPIVKGRPSFTRPVRSVDGIYREQCPLHGGPVKAVGRPPCGVDWSAVLDVCPVSPGRGATRACPVAHIGRRRTPRSRKPPPAFRPAGPAPPRRVWALLGGQEGSAFAPPDSLAGIGIRSDATDLLAVSDDRQVRPPLIERALGEPSWRSAFWNIARYARPSAIVAFECCQSAALYLSFYETPFRALGWSAA